MGGDGLRLSGAKADKVIIAKPSTFPAGSSARTSAAWVKTKSNTARQFIISYGSKSGISHKHWNFELNGWIAKHQKDFGVHIWSGNVYTTNEFLKADTWYHVAATYPAKGNVGSIKLYLNGVLVKKGYAIDHKGAIPKTATNVAWIGNRPADQSGPYQGTISSAYMWSRELSAAEISQLYKAGRLGTMRAGVKVPPPPSLRDKSHKIWSGCVLRHEYAITGNSGDMCGGDNPGSLKGGAKIVKGDGLRLSGAKADKVVIAKPSTFPSGSSARTSAAWVKTKSDSARQFIISYGTTSGASHKHWDFELN